MYMLFDTGYTKSTVIFFITFAAASSYFMLDLALAVIWENSVYGGNRMFFSGVARKLGKFVLDVVRSLES